MTIDAEHVDPAWEKATAKAVTLAGALPWLKRYHGKVVVVKYGGVGGRGQRVGHELYAEFSCT